MVTIDSKAYTNKMHLECSDACTDDWFIDVDGTYRPFDNDRAEKELDK